MKLTEQGKKLWGKNVDIFSDYTSNGWIIVITARGDSNKLIAKNAIEVKALLNMGLIDFI